MERFAKNRKLFSQKAQLLRSDRVMNVPLVGRTSDGIIHSGGKDLRWYNPFAK